MILKGIIMVIFLVTFIPIASADSVSLDNWIFDLKNGAYISIPYLFNATNFTNTVTGELQFWLNDSKLQWRTGSNKTLTNIKYNNISDEFSFTASGTNGYLSFSSLMQTVSANYTFYLDGVATANSTSNETGIVTFNYTGAWSSHEFIINYTPAEPLVIFNATTDNFHVYLDGAFIQNTTNLSYNATGLNPSQSYTLSIRAHNNTYDSYSSWVNDTRVTGYNTAPTISNATNQTCLPHSCVISFDVNQSNATTQIKYGLNESLLQSTINQTNGTSRTDNLTGLTNNTKYYYSVWAWNSSDDTKYSNSTIQNFTTLEDYVPPTTPLIFNVLNQTCLAHSCVVSFNVNQSNATTQIKYGLNESLLQSTVNQTNGTSRTDNLTGLTNNTKYYYSVFAYNSSEVSKYSNSTIQNFTTLEDYVPPPPVPGNLIISSYPLNNTHYSMNTEVNFSVVTTIPVTYSWKIDNIEVSTSQYFLKTYTSVGSKLVHVNVTGGGFSDTNNWKILITRNMATSTNNTQNLEHSWFQYLVDSIKGGNRTMATSANLTQNLDQYLDQYWSE